MLKVKTFLSILRDSLLPQHPFYAKLLKTKFSESLKFFIAANIFFYLLYLISISILMPPKFAAYRPKNISQGLAAFPDNLVITITNGQLITNYSHPYFLWSKDGQNHLILVVDETGGPEKITEYRSAILLSARHITFRNPISGSYKTYGLDSLNLKIDKEAVQSYSKRFEMLIASAVIIGILAAILIMPIIFLLMSFVYMLIASLISFIVWKTTEQYHRRNSVTLKKIIQISFHTITFPLLLSVIFTLINVHILFSMPFLLICLIVLNSGLYEAYLKEIDKPAHHKKHS